MAKAAQLDFTNVKEGGVFNKKRYPEGDYKGVILKVADANKKDDKKVKMWLFTIKVKSGTYPYYCTYTAENQLWKIRNLFVAAGMNVPKKRMSVDPNKVVGKAIGVTLEDDEYDGKEQSVVSATFPLSELEGDADDDESDDDDSDDDEEEDEEDSDDDDTEEEDSDDEEEDDEEDEEEEPPPPPKKKNKKKAEPPAKKKGKKKTDDDDDLEELDIEDL